MSEEIKNQSEVPQSEEKVTETVVAPTRGGVLPLATTEEYPLKAILGRKVGMTRIYDEAGNHIPVSVISTEGCALTGVRTVDRDGYSAVQLGVGSVKERKMPKSFLGQFKKSGLPLFRFLKEIRVPNSSKFQVGKRVPLDVFNLGDYVDVSGTTKGKGFAGTMKRHNFRGLTETHGASDKVRARGSSGGGSGQPQRVFKGTRMAGRMGGDWTTFSKVEVVRIDKENDFLLVKGPLPGAVGTFVLVKQTTRARKVKLAQQAKKTSLKKEVNTRGGKK